MRVQVEPSVHNLLKNDSSVDSIKRQLNMVFKYTSTHGIVNALTVSFFQETKRKGVFFKEIGNYLLVFCFLKNSTRIEEMCIFDLLDVNTSDAKCLKENGIYKHKIIEFTSDVVTNY